ncbi:hypothetical protein NFI95_00630 [Acetobacteraceae bacterium KSS8]|uniref:Uncharacterized protein n=1 Tax=Endosaccharibacter trunci TaxID=2812733 RepID=A0ABT1W255_9PROT|nr:hypothetical protein [Acetobacteraceae bacterium KSS8]
MGRVGWLRTSILPLPLLCASPADAGAPPMPPPFDTDLTAAAAPFVKADEQLRVLGRRVVVAPLPSYGNEIPPWEAGRAIRDPRTGASTTVFGNAYNLGSVMGSDERSNETGGQFLAPRHQ